MYSIMLLGVLQNIQRVHQREIKSNETQKIDRKEQCIYTHTHTHTHTHTLYTLLPSNNQQKCSKYMYTTHTTHTHTTHTHSITRMCKLGVYFSLSLQQEHVILHNHYKNINTIGKSPLLLCPKYYYCVVKRGNYCTCMIDDYLKTI